jgi:hypothetical protein
LQKSWEKPLALQGNWAFAWKKFLKPKWGKKF